MAAEVWVLNTCRVEQCQFRSVGKASGMQPQNSGKHTVMVRMGNTQGKPHVKQKMVDNEYDLLDSTKLEEMMEKER